MGLKLVLIFVGGGIGSMLRYGFSLWFNPVFSFFPLGTFLVNVISSFILGIAFALWGQKIIRDEIYLLMTTGFCGGFGTFSAFGLETLKYIEKAQYLPALMNCLINVLLCVAAVFVGIKMTRLFLN